METKTMALDTVIRILSKTAANIEDVLASTTAKEWLDIFNTFDGATIITFTQPDDERRLWCLLENQKPEILAQLPTEQPGAAQEVLNEHEEINNIKPEIVVETASLSTQSEALPLIEETILPTQQPALESQNKSLGEATGETTKTLLADKSAIASNAVDKPAFHENVIAAIIEKPSLPAPAAAVPNTYPSFFNDSKKVADSFNEAISVALDMAFKNTNAISVSQFKSIMTVLEELKQNIVLSEARTTARLEAIYNTTCISANNTESLSGMFNTQTKTKHIPEFAV